MFDRHQAKITVMQSIGHSLPVHQSTNVPWDFYLVPFFQPSPPTLFRLITAIGMYHFPPLHHFGMACLAGSKFNIQQVIVIIILKACLTLCPYRSPAHHRGLLQLFKCIYVYLCVGVYGTTSLISSSLLQLKFV